MNAAARALDLANEAQGLNQMFANWPNGMNHRYQGLLSRPYDNTMFDNILQSVNLNAPTNIIRPQHVGLGWVRTALDRNAQGNYVGVQRGLMILYTCMICEYINTNTVPPSNLQGTIPRCSMMGHNFYPVHRGPWPPPPMPTLNAWYTAAMAAFTARYTPAQFLTIRHLFVPIFLQRYASNPNAGSYHVCMLVISPLARTIDYLDSGNWRPEQDIMGHFFGLLARYLGRLFDLRD
jgi:hypothetical protein